ncbi:hypothetical protein ANN_12668 [Periplaneta americana]|uniref:Uncharacterized protein n=1 Tax=Periplaneta americana TaxID=6978 RepID=A0ABQ8TJS0_PERAM|nr:hypothetical protein ANN_12668 [Periplaneta americana]
MAGLCEGGNEPPGSLKASDNAGEMSPGSSIKSYPVFARIGLRENPGKNLNQVTCPDRDLNPDHLVSRPDALTVTPQDGVVLILGVQFKVCHGSLYAVMWLADERREFNLPTLPQRCITYEAEKLRSKYGVHSAVGLKPDGLWRVLCINPFDNLVGFFRGFPHRKGKCRAIFWRILGPHLISLHLAKM